MISVLKAVRKEVLFHVEMDLQKNVLQYSNFGRSFYNVFVIIQIAVWGFESRNHLIKII